MDPVLEGFADMKLEDVEVLFDCLQPNVSRDVDVAVGIDMTILGQNVVQSALLVSRVAPKSLASNGGFCSKMLHDSNIFFPPQVTAIRFALSGQNLKCWRLFILLHIAAQLQNLRKRGCTLSFWIAPNPIEKLKEIFDKIISTAPNRGRSNMREICKKVKTLNNVLAHHGLEKIDIDGQRWKNLKNCNVNGWNHKDEVYFRWEDMTLVLNIREGPGQRELPLGLWSLHDGLATMKYLPTQAKHLIDYRGLVTATYSGGHIASIPWLRVVMDGHKMTVSPKCAIQKCLDTATDGAHLLSRVPAYRGFTIIAPSCRFHNRHEIHNFGVAMDPEARVVMVRAPARIRDDFVDKQRAFIEAQASKVNPQITSHLEQIALSEPSLPSNFDVKERTEPFWRTALGWLPEDFYESIAATQQVVSGMSEEWVKYGRPMWYLVAREDDQIRWEGVPVRGKDRSIMLSFNLPKSFSGEVAKAHLAIAGDAKVNEFTCFSDGCYQSLLNQAGTSWKWARRMNGTSTDA